MTSAASRSLLRAAVPLVLLPALLTACTASSPEPPGQTFWDPGAGTAAQRFELARRSEPELIAFLRRFPKGADLHNHIGGATYAGYQLDSARALGKRYDVARGVFVDGDEDGENTISLDALERSPEHLARFRDSISMRGWYPGVNGRDHFFQTFGRISSSGRSGPEILAEILERNRYQNVQYLELMAAPIPVVVIGRFAGAFEGLDLDDLDASVEPLAPLVDDAGIHQAIRAEADRLEAAAADLLGTPISEHPVEVRYVLSLDRVGSLERFFAAAVLFATAIRADDRIIAINMVAPEDAPAARRQFDTQMRILDFVWRRFGPFNVTLHAGELALGDSPVEPMENRIRRSIEEGHAQRIGHGVSVAWERDLPGLLADMRDDGVMVEVNLTSNEGILGVTGREHPFAMYRAAGVPVCLTTDDEGVNRSNLTKEYVKAVERYQLGYADVKTLSRNCLEHSFARGESLFLGGDYARIRPDFAKVGTAGWRPSGTQQALLDANEKLRLQVGLERAFVRFEDSLLSGYREATR